MHSHVNMHISLTLATDFYPLCAGMYVGASSTFSTYSMTLTCVLEDNSHAITVSASIMVGGKLCLEETNDHPHGCWQTRYAMTQRNNSVVIPRHVVILWRECIQGIMQ